MHSRMTGQERSKLADKVLAVKGKSKRTGEELNWLQLWRRKLDEYGIEMPAVEIVYKGLTVKTEALVGAAGIPTVISPMISLGKVGVMGLQQKLPSSDRLQR